MLDFIFVSYKSDEHVQRLAKLQIWERFKRTARFIILRVGEDSDSEECLEHGKIITTTRNLGYLQSAINYVRECSYTNQPFIVVANADVTFTEQQFSNFVNWLCEEGRIGHRYAILAPNIINLNGNYQNPFWVKELGTIFWIKQRIIYSSKTAYYFYEKIKKKLKAKLPETTPDGVMSVFAVHGSFFAVTPSLLLELPDKFPTLWAEELTLAFENKYRSGATLINYDICIHHLDSPSTKKLDFERKKAKIITAQKFLIKNYWTNNYILRIIYGV